MKILLIAPEICVPATEGRKKFVVELYQALASHEDLEIQVLTTTLPNMPCLLDKNTMAYVSRPGFMQLFTLIIRLPYVLWHFRPCAVVIFPYGSFRGIRKIASLSFILFMRILCKVRGTIYLFFLYAFDDKINTKTLRFISGNLACGKKNYPGVYYLPHGINVREIRTPSVRQISNTKTQLSILFLAGMWQKTQERYYHVLYERGLVTLLEAGDMLASRGYKLTIAAPLFSDPILAEQLLYSTHNRWPHDYFNVIGEVNVSELLLKTDLFVFPYLKELGDFKPTSILEALLKGVPVLASETRFLRELGDTLGDAIHFFKVGDKDDLVRQVDSIFISNRINDEIKKTQAYIITEFNRETIADRLLEILKSVGLFETRF
jgi:glycosyltransferase involved in cell wall biosynthesis